jgi:hypothetical protein
LEISRTAAWSSILVNWFLCGAILKWRFKQATRYGK